MTRLTPREYAAILATRRARQPAPPAPGGPVPLAEAIAETVAALTAGPPRVLELPPGLELLTANDRPAHWAVRHRIYATLREQACLAAAGMRPVGRCVITGEYQPAGTSRVRDGANWAPSIKPCVDGLRDAGVLPGDDAGWVPLECYRIGPAYPPHGRLAVYLHPVPPGPGAGQARVSRPACW